jgi:hypothetical protein
MFGMTVSAGIVAASCVTAQDPCNDTGTSLDLSGLIVPGIILAVILLCLLVYYGWRGTRGS